MPRQNLHLLIIDPQNDFCDLPAEYCPEIAGRRCAPALPVGGAHADMLRLANVLRGAGSGLSEITVTLDSHQHLDIAHPGFWQQGDGAPVAPFTQISAAQVKAGQYRPREAAAQARCLAYLEALEATGRYTHMVWPVHCEIGTWGHGVHPALVAAYNQWETACGRTVAKLLKGTNPWTEHYSAVKAEVPDPADPSTQLNTALIASLARADQVFIAGEASSHCVKATTEHIAECFGPAQIGKLVLLTDCMSPVAGFEAQHAAFLADLHGRGARLADAQTALAAWRANA